MSWRSIHQTVSGAKAVSFQARYSSSTEIGLQTGIIGAGGLCGKAELRQEAQLTGNLTSALTLFFSVKTLCSCD